MQQNKSVAHAASESLKTVRSPVGDLEYYKWSMIMGLFNKAQRKRYGVINQSYL